MNYRTELPKGCTGFRDFDRIVTKDIMKRWTERVLAAGWESRASGADEYMKKYGKNISNDKIKALADYAYSCGCNDFGDRLMEYICEWKEFTLEQAEAMGDLFDGDAIDSYVDYQEEPNLTLTLFEGTIRELAKRNAGTVCGSVGNTCYKNIATKYPDVLVRGCLIVNANDNIISTSSVIMKVSAQSTADDISALAGDGDGSLRNDCCGNHAWTYFETE